MISDFAKEKVMWTKKMNLKLVRFIEKKPNIWNPKHPKYTSVISRDSTYAEFAAKYGNVFTGQAVKERWTNIRSTFASYLRKLKASRNKGDGEEYKVHWHLWKACQFLKKVNRNVKSSSNTDTGKEEWKDTAVSDYQDDSSEEDHFSDSVSMNDSDLSCKNIVNNLVNVFKAVQNDAFGLANTRYGEIGSAVSKNLSKMNSYEAAKISAKIMDILLFYDQNNPMNPNS